MWILKQKFENEMVEGGDTVQKGPDMTEEVKSSPETQDSWEALDEAFDSSDVDLEVEPEVDVPEETPTEVVDEAPVETEVPAEKETKVEPEGEVEEAVAETAPQEEITEEVTETPEKEAKKEEVPEEQPQEQQPQWTPEQLHEARDQAVKQLTDSYQLSEDEAELLETEPAQAFPKMAAELHTRVYENVIQNVMQMLPTAMTNVLTQRDTVQKREETFYAEYPELREYSPQVTQIAQLWRQMNPEADSARARKEIGKIAMSALDLQPTTPVVRESAPVEAVSSTPVTPTTSRVTPSPSQRSSNPYTAMAEAWDEEDLD